MGETLTDFVSGVGKGVDKQLIVNIELSDALQAQGITTTTAKFTISDRMKLKKGMSVYFISKTEISGKFIAKALNEQGQEIGRSTVAVEFSNEDAKYILFEFSDETDMNTVQKYLIDLKK